MRLVRNVQEVLSGIRPYQCSVNEMHCGNKNDPNKCLACEYENIKCSHGWEDCNGNCSMNHS